MTDSGASQTYAAARPLVIESKMLASSSLIWIVPGLMSLNLGSR